MSRLRSHRRVLITQSALFTFAGSETATFELAEHFSLQGDSVIVVTHGWSLQWLNRFAALNAVEVMALADPEVDLSLATDPPDLAWVHHQVIPERVLRSPGDTQFIFHHMSVTHPAEFPISHRVERALASAVVFPAQETLDFHAGFGLLDGVEPARLEVLGNPAPDSFGQRRHRGSEELRRLLIVSNHIPGELQEALEQLDGIELRVRGNGGRSGSISAPITPGDFDWADAVVSIGKTVQYSLVASVPVFCYDYFGGPGWLSDQNLETAAYSNFSGRGFSKKSARDVAEQLRGGFHEADLWAMRRGESMRARYLIGEKLPALLAHVEQKTPVAIDESDILAHVEMQKAQGILVNVGAGAEVTTIKATDRLHDIEIDLASTRAQLEVAQRHVAEIVASRTFRAVQRLNALRHGRLRV